MLSKDKIYKLSSISMDAEIKKSVDREAEFLRLLQVKAEKMTNMMLEKKFTQLSYLSKEERDFQVAIAKNVILDKFIGLIHKL